MSPVQKSAWFNLVVVTVTLILVFSLYPFLGHAAMGSLGILGALGFTPLFFRKTSGKVLIDERDRLIQGRSWFLAYVLFWVVFVLAAVFLSVAIYGQNGAIPVNVVQMSVGCGFMFVTAVASIAILVQYGGTGDGGE